MKASRLNISEGLAAQVMCGAAQFLPGMSLLETSEILRTPKCRRVKSACISNECSSHGLERATAGCVSEKGRAQRLEGNEIDACLPASFV